jgi:hypothetical protein
MATVTICFTLDSEKDKRLLRWLDGLPKRGRSEAIREVLAAHLGQNGITLRDIYEAIQELKRCGVAVVSQDDREPQADIPADVLENLGRLGL